MQLATTNTAELSEAIESINVLMVRGMEAWKSAGRIVADLVDRDADVIDRIVQLSPMLTKGILRSLERIGRDELVPELLLKNGLAYAKLRELPVQTQRRLLREPIPLLIETKTGVDTLNVTLDALSPQQVRQVFSHDGVRTPAEQRAWMVRNVRPMDYPEAERLPYEIHAKTVTFVRPCKLSKSDIAAILNCL